MIIVHDENLNAHHIIYEHPESYTDILNAEGRTWIHSQQALSIEEIHLSRHPETNALQLHRKREGSLELMPHDDKHSVERKRIERAEALERQRQAHLLAPKPIPVAAPAYSHVWTVKI